MLTKTELQELIPSAQKLAEAVVKNKFIPIEFAFTRDDLKVVFHVEATRMSNDNPIPPDSDLLYVKTGS